MHELALLVDHMVCRLPQGVGKALPQDRVLDTVVDSLVHAKHPLISLGRTDRKREVPHPQSRVAKLLPIEIGSAQPSGEKFEKLGLRAIQIGRMHPSDARGFGQSIHVFVETADQLRQNRFTTNSLVGRNAVLLRHRASGFLDTLAALPLA